MRVYYYHTQDITAIRRRYDEGTMPSHLLYGALRMADNGIDVVWHATRPNIARWRMIATATWRILRYYRRYDAVYASHHEGLDVIILLRALHLFRKPLVVWHHQPVVTAPQRWRERLGRIAYRGFDRLVFFSQKIADDSLLSPKTRPERVVVGRWGADIDFYARLAATVKRRSGFISTGKELRDMATLTAAFNAEGCPLDIYIAGNNGGVSYERFFKEHAMRPNIRVHCEKRFDMMWLAERVNEAACVVICCRETRYTVGLTTLVEGIALGIPVVISRNPNIPIDVDAAGCGISVPYGDVDGWRRAVRYIADRPEEAREMGRKGRLLAERMYNDRRCAREMAAVIREVVARR